jgi:Temperature dependent protein affecting M2 dsRNA replication
MAYLDKHPTRKDGKQAFEAIMGSPELLLYDIEYSIITKIDFTSGLFYALVKPSLPQKLNVSEDTLTNALLMTGTSFLPAFPVLKETDIIKQQPFTINDAINMYRTANKSMITLCDTWTEILQKQEPNWQDKYRKAKMAIKHHIHVEEHDGMAAVIVSNSDQLTGDHPEYIALNLPQELYHYLIHGDIGRRVMNWLSYLEMLVFPPLAGGDAAEYRRLITEQLVPIQSQSIALYTSRLHRGFQHRNITIRFWFDNNTTVVIKPLAVEPAPDGLAATWRVNQTLFENQKASASTKPGSLSFAMLSLQNTDFAATTKKAVTETQNLKSQSEILSNAMWRLLHLRGYIDNEHRPTKWGTALIATFDLLNSMELDSINEIEEAAFLAFELLQFDQLNARNRHSQWIGAPQKGSEQDKDHCLLIARCACLLKLRHKETGYTGPLSKNLLAYHSIISAVRDADRDLVEAIIVSMFMFAHADRKSACDDKSAEVRKRNNLDWQELGLRYVHSGQNQPNNSNKLQPSFWKRRRYWPWYCSEDLS